MKNRNKLIAFIMLNFLLCSCDKTNELYGNKPYDTGTFDGNYYLEQNNVDNIKIGNVIEKDASSVTYISNPSFGEKLTGIIPSDQQIVTKDDNGEEITTNLEWNNDVPHDDYGVGYGPTKNLISIDNSFAYGFLSRLYDGRVRCDGYYAESRVQINKTGYGTFFPKVLQNATYFGIALRGQTSCEGFDNSIADVDVNIKFYKHNTLKEEHDVIDIKCSNVLIPTNTHGATSFMLFYFIDVLGLNYLDYINGVVAMSMSFKLNEIKGNDADKLTYGNPVDDKDNITNPHFALMLYEVMIPDSSWN